MAFWLIAARQATFQKIRAEILLMRSLSRFILHLQAQRKQSAVCTAANKNINWSANQIPNASMTWPTAFGDIKAHLMDDSEKYELLGQYFDFV